MISLPRIASHATHSLPVSSLTPRDHAVAIDAMEGPQRSAAWAAIEAIEMKAFERIQVQPGLSSLLAKLKANGVSACTLRARDGASHSLPASGAHGNRDA